MLITLGIIGVVAALTLPSLIQNHRKSVIETRLRKFHSTINQAIRLAELEHSEISTWEYPTSAYSGEQVEKWYKTYITPYVKTQKTEHKGSQCYLYFLDGSKALFFVHYTLAGAPPSFHIYFYPDAKTKTDLFGKNLFTFYLNPVESNYIKTYDHGWDGTRQQLLTGTYGCASDNIYKHYCAKLIEYDNWKIPDDYPIKF